MATTLEAEYRVPTYVYHGGMERSARSMVQDAFIGDPNGIMIATNAFGMGIDRPDVRWVLHYNMPGTLEAYYQEAGRAGRDGRLRSACCSMRRRTETCRSGSSKTTRPPKRIDGLHRAVAARVQEGVAKVSIDELFKATRLSM